MDGDYIVRASAAGHTLRAFAITSRDIVEEARRIHDTSPVATAALGRLLTAGSMMGSMMKGENDILTILPPNARGKLDVAGALGPGFLNVIRDIGMKEPYNGQIELVSGEIAEDLTYYYVTSEQVPTAVGLGVLMDKDNFVKQAGGFIIQVMPDADDEIIDRLEESISNIHSVTDLLEDGMSPEDILEFIMKGTDLEILEKIPARYHCNCSKARVSRAIASLGRNDIQEMIDEGVPVEVKCHFCNLNYIFNVEELERLIR